MADFVVQADNGTPAIIGAASGTPFVVSGALRGPIGATGPVGPIGPVGPTGPAGPQGLQGPVGPKGDTGATGAAGPAGADSTVPGPTGPAGPTGATGPAGPTGATGPQGPQGPAGSGTGDMLKSVYDPANVNGQLAGKTYVDTQLAGKAASSHTHAQSDVTGLASALAAKAALSHTHPITDLTATGTPSATTYLRGDGTWATPAGGGGSYSDPVIIVAAVGSPAAWIAVADYACDGTADNVEIQSAITAAKVAGTRIILAPGTYNIAATITVDGTDNPDAGYVIEIAGAGAAQTILSCASNVNGISLNTCCRVNLHDFQVQVGGTGSGIVCNTIGSTTKRTFWQSNFRNLYFVGPWDSTHTGWAMKLTAPFRSTFENIEVGGTRNGIQLIANNNAFNPGDCTFNRCFVEIAGGSGVAYHLTSTAANSTMNQVTFNMCEAICDGSASTTGILLDGSGMASWNTFTGINLEQFGTIIDIANGDGNRFDCHYVEPRPTGKFVNFGSGSVNNYVTASYIYSASTQTLVSDTNSTSQPNYVWRTRLYDDTGSVITLTTTNTIFLHNTKQGSGTVPAAWLGNNIKTTPRNSSVASTATLTIDANSTDLALVTAQAAALTIAAPTGTPNPGQKLLIRIKDNGTARALTWNAIFRAIGVTLPATTTVNKTVYVGLMYNAADTKWDAIAVAQEA